MVTRIDILTRIGAIVSTTGVSLFVTFVIILLVFPVNRYCGGPGPTCSYLSTAPTYLQPIVNPAFLSLCLILIAVGILFIRYSGWKDSKKT